MRHFLDFEKSIAELEGQIEELRRGLLRLPEGRGAGTAARFVHRVAGSLAEDRKVEVAAGELVPSEGRQ